METQQKLTSKQKYILAKTYFSSEDFTVDMSYAYRRRTVNCLIAKGLVKFDLDCYKNVLTESGKEIAKTINPESFGITSNWRVREFSAS